MHKLLQAGMVMAALGAMLPGAVQAQRIVYDPAIYGQALQQVTQLSQQLAVMQQQYQQLMQTYQAIAHLPQTELNQLGQQLNVATLRNALPAQSTVLGTIMNGSSAGTGNLAAATQTYLNQNHVYTPTAQDFQAQEMQRNASSIAGVQGMASTLYQSAADRVTALQGIESQLASAPDTKAVADIQARLSAEQTYIQAQQVQAQSLAMWQASQQRNQEQRLQEERRRQIDTLIEDAKAHGG